MNKSFPFHAVFFFALELYLCLNTICMMFCTLVDGLVFLTRESSVPSKNMEFVSLDTGENKRTNGLLQLCKFEHVQ
jgi:hypothetical protein